MIAQSTSETVTRLRSSSDEEGVGKASFEQIRFLGQGSFGQVMLVKKKEGGRMGGQTFALKELSKQGVLQGGQLEHVKEEKAVLEILNHPFILKLYATFQEKDYIYFLTEALSGGELWSIIYEGHSGFGTGGLPSNQTIFYGANVVEAIGYIHTKGIAYRDLKPENLVVDSEGYLRLIDMGFAKKIPFVVEVDGEVQVHPKSHTMCGTPEYLAPEFIFNKGHDHSADYWAMGVLIFELVMAHTPFMPDKDADGDMTPLFTAIACVKRKGVPFPESFDEKAGGPHCRDLVLRLLQFDPAARLGNLANRVKDIKEHPFFETVDWDDLTSKKVKVPWRPGANENEDKKEGEEDGEDEEEEEEEEMPPPQHTQPYTGNPALFADF